MPEFMDIADLEEDERINQIGKAAMRQKKRVGFVTDSEPGKAERYIEKLKKGFPGIAISSPRPGPVPDTVLVTVGPPVN